MVEGSTNARLHCPCLAGVEDYEKVSGHSIVAEIAGISDLETDGRLESLEFEYISHRKRPSGRGHERTELTERAL